MQQHNAGQAEAEQGDAGRTGKQGWFNQRQRNAAAAAAAAAATQHKTSGHRIASLGANFEVANVWATVQ